MSGDSHNCIQLFIFTTARLSHSLIGSKMVMRSFLLSSWIHCRPCWRLLCSNSRRGQSRSRRECNLLVYLETSLVGKGSLLVPLLPVKSVGQLLIAPKLCSPKLTELLSCLLLLVPPGPCRNFVVLPTIQCHANPIPTLSLMWQPLPPSPTVCVVMLEFGIKTVCLQGKDFSWRM